MMATEKRNRTTTRPLTQPIGLGCEYWFDNRTKCAETAFFVIESPQGESLGSCAGHRAKLVRALWIERQRIQDQGESS